MAHKFCPKCGYALGGEVDAEAENGPDSDQFSSEHLDQRATPSDDSQGEFAAAIQNRKRNRWVRS